ncbi:hypothetical protein BP6252_02985 [Coleophoma cylindrospora]|uniref:NADH:flavin oxidoreductase/NADH oxidase N-terminal domain-containing protein n=1 Tax=Coleophoma cylindrospora TaxID=1849047 RepID=A0A3D8S6E3_9HELO|nr:hypothetical protein BP6252_02985 [Coleophoma cylindrospora]
MAPTDPLFEPLQFAGHELQHRIALAPMTRMRASVSGVINNTAAEYYSLRATPGGLLISEGLVPHPRGCGYPRCPGIYTAEQVEAWKPITAAVKEKGGVFFAQLWHVGRAAVPSQTGGFPALSATAVPLLGMHPLFGKGETEPYVQGEAMTLSQIEEVTEQFVQAAKNAIAAGFDGIEIHGANGYLFDTFVHSNINDRTDDYGGSLQNRLRFPLQVIDAISAAIGASKTAIRLSPFYELKGTHDANRIQTFSAYTEALEQRGLAYVHMIEARYDQQSEDPPSNQLSVQDSTLWTFRKILKNTKVVAAGGYTAETAREALLEGKYFILSNLLFLSLD